MKVLYNNLGNFRSLLRQNIVNRRLELLQLSIQSLRIWFFFTAGFPLCGGGEVMWLEASSLANQIGL